MRRIIRAVFLTALLVLLAGSAALAAADTVRASCPSVGPDEVIWQKNKAGYYLCLPGGWDASAVRLTADGSESLLLGAEGIRIPADGTADLRPWLGTRVALKRGDGKRLGNVLIMQGSPVTSLLFQVNEKEFRIINGNREKRLSSGRVTAVEADGGVSCSGSLRQMKTRGNNSFFYPKKSYEFKLEDKAPLAGMPKDRTWILLANYADVSMLRNQITLDLCGEIGLPYSLRCAPADVWVNGEYLGLYLLTEKIQIKKHRVGIANLEDAMKEVNDGALDSYPQTVFKDGPVPFMRGNDIPNDPEDITGGYIVVIEKPYRVSKYGYNGIATADNIHFHVKEPTNPSRAELTYLAERLQHLHDAVWSDDGYDPATGRHYSEYLDVASFVLKWLVDDMNKNYDVAAGSQYMFKDSDRTDPLFYAGPAWDYDIAYGNAWRYTSPEKDYPALKPDKKYFFAQLGKHEDFRKLLTERWKDTLRPAMAILTGEIAPSPDGVLRSFAEYRDAIALSAEMNEVRRGKGTVMTKDAGTDFRSGVEYLGEWLVERTRYLDVKWTGSVMQMSSGTEEGAVPEESPAPGEGPVPEADPGPAESAVPDESPAPESGTVGAEDTIPEGGI